MARAGPREEAIEGAYSSLRRTIGAFHSLHRGADQGRLSRPHWMLLRVIAMRGDSTPKELAEFMGLTQGSITPALDRLEEEGLIVRKRSTRDRRVVDVRLTPAARRLWRQMDRAAMRQLSTLFEGWSLAEIQSLRGLLDRLAQRAWEECGPPPFLRGTKFARGLKDKD